MAKLIDDDGTVFAITDAGGNSAQESFTLNPAADCPNGAPSGMAGAAGASSSEAGAGGFGGAPPDDLGAGGTADLTAGAGGS